ncbi:hypothetical protein Q4511_00995 [Paracoccus sp. 1_MG-2023]|uniref:hypothetical protein n=1 Tax=unclassified Paracoccus (in: a-proteobacteria) TaxID=2688777 RepID=UPI001C090A17|nr:MULTISPECIES: hypothetical protein [unclassified Paracoccus (in: a-proteobacteria)]MBU2957664.1 hypothetical protein [Paracoccus sp. C2R09]MDO6667488.1 hypothetical protein [Paracoccus sp. 1_MG-2023]
MTDTRTNLPPITADTLAAILISGAVGTVAFDLWGQAISPMLGFANLAPVGLARSLLGTLGLPNGAPAGHLMHLFLVGLLAYPIGWLFVFRPLQQHVAPAIPMIVSAIAYGAGLWVFAIGGVTAVAGLPFFLGFTGITWVALVGHVIYAIFAALTFEYLNRR